MTAADVPGPAADPAASPDGNAGGRGESGATSTAARLVTGALRVLAPTALITAILYYFGWARTSAAAEAAQIDQSLFGYSTTDYVLRSISPLYRPLGFRVLLVLLVLLLSAFLDGALATHGRSATWQRWLGPVSGALTVAAVLCLAIGATRLEDVQQQQPRHYSATLIVTAAVLLWLVVIISRSDEGPVGRAIAGVDPVMIGLVVLLALVGLFAFVLRLAFEDGAGGIQEFIADLDRQPHVVVTSSEPLDIEHLPSVTLDYLPPDDELGRPLRYRYSGLHLLIESNDRLFLVTDEFGTDVGSSGLAVIPSSSDLRIDFLAVP